MLIYCQVSVMGPWPEPARRETGLPHLLFSNFLDRVEKIPLYTPSSMTAEALIQTQDGIRGLQRYKHKLKNDLLPVTVGT